MARLHCTLLRNAKRRPHEHVKATTSQPTDTLSTKPGASPSSQHHRAEITTTAVQKSLTRSGSDTPFDGTIGKVAGLDQDRVALLHAMRQANPAAARDELVAIARRLQDADRRDPSFVDALFRLASLGFVREAWRTCMYGEAT